jgi:hypothetical protein
VLLALYDRGGDRLDHRIPSAERFRHLLVGIRLAQQHRALLSTCCSRLTVQVTSLPEALGGYPSLLREAAQ